MIATGGPRISMRLVPLLDILFLLLAFFVIMPHGMKSVQQQLAPPPDWSKREIDRLVQVRLEQDGYLRWGDNRFALDEVAGRMTQLGPRDLVLVREAWDAKQKDVLRLHELLDARQAVYVVLQEPRR